VAQAGGESRARARVQTHLCTIWVKNLHLHTHGHTFTDAQTMGMFQVSGSVISSSFLPDLTILRLLRLESLE
jgi:hypothetical protein